MGFMMPNNTDDRLEFDVDEAESFFKDSFDPSLYTQDYFQKMHLTDFACDYYIGLVKSIFEFYNGEIDDLMGEQLKVHKKNFGDIEDHVDKKNVENTAIDAATYCIVLAIGYCKSKGILSPSVNQSLF